MKTHEMDDSAGEFRPGGGTFAAPLSNLEEQRKRLLGAHVAWFKGAVSNPAAAPPTEKRSVRVYLSMTPTEFERLLQLARQDRRDPSEMAYVLVMDFLDGKLAPVAPQPEEAA